MNVKTPRVIQTRIRSLEMEVSSNPLFGMEKEPIDVLAIGVFFCNRLQWLDGLEDKPTAQL